MLSNSGINKVFLVGHIGKEPRLHSFQNEPQMLCFPLVTLEFIRKNGETTEHQEWHYIKLPADATEEKQDLKKGQLVYVQGKIQTRKIVDEQQVKRYKTEILAQQIQVLNNPVQQADFADQ
ncbi:single-stranded DNA-binding protein [Mucilaginibacter sp. RS28]|uniref:Single-stranded DNA-binding protein n=1 Tax=Mucilaginibacter straminoryzae TaxID=2932774 RepID=A0A9X2BC32_9SPHI|nr:single-stranded DNA-binding protein [Mucilaginibacter straminoryzae]MCJ8210467.1 single-stranded DNA-binding protein [Mucilaginibacter straminoryzae]